MSDWIPFKEGDYLVERAFLTAPDHQAVPLEDTVISVYKGKGGYRMRGSCRVRNKLVVDLLEDSDYLGLVIDLGHDLRYLMENPELKGGKVFSPDVRSTLQFSPSRPWVELTEEEFGRLAEGVLGGGR